MKSAFVSDMKIAIPQLRGRVSPVLDVASNVLVVDIEAGLVCGRHCVDLVAEQPARRAQCIADLGIDVVICGALSRAQKVALVSAGVEFIPRVCGSIEAVLAGYLSGRVQQGELTMPGCPQRRPRIERHGE